jgi:hypothetical protein
MDSGRKAISIPLSPSRGEGMGVRGPGTLPTHYQRSRDTANPASSCTVRGARGRGVSPLTPTPLPFQGRGEPDANSGRKAISIPPLPFEGRGDGGEGSRNPASPLSTLPGHCESSILVNCPSCAREGRFTPHPHPSPLPGRGEPGRIPGEKQFLSPLSPSRGEGMGVRGPGTLPAPHQRSRDTANPASSCTVRRARGRDSTPHPRPLSPGRGEGSQMRIPGEKQFVSPLSPSRGEGMGVSGPGTLPAPHQRSRDTANPASSCTVRGARGRGGSPLTPTLSPGRGEGSQIWIPGEKQFLSPSPLRGERGWG